MRYISETVQHEVFTGTSRDAHGNTVETWADAVSLGIYAFNPGTSSETSGSSAASGHEARTVTTPSIYLPSTASVSARDRITVRGKRFEVDGEPLDFRNPYGGEMNGKSISLKAVDG